MNSSQQAFADHDSVWVFGYGSLLYKADFPYRECRPATITGWVRRFWQGSHDHRGTPTAPGRVVTLIESPGSRCAGLAYRVSPDVLGPLDVREKNGYLRFATPMAFHDGGTAQGLVYIATERNPAFLGDAPLDEMARHIDRSHGPSGANRAYLVELARSLRALGERDDHVFALEAKLPVQCDARSAPGDEQA
ncbi:MAG: gamma-glutamylcyclotransferase [Ectothiorhodospiraceae bacterium]